MPGNKWSRSTLTLNAEQDVEQLVSHVAKDVENLPEGTRFAWQVERGEHTHHLHVQGYAEIPTRLGGRGWQRLFPGWSVILSKGTREENIAYVTKSNTHVRGPYGLETFTGAPTTVGGNAESLLRRIRDGATAEELKTEFPKLALKHWPTILNWIQDQKVSRPAGTPEVWVLWGDVGAGKTMYAQQLLGDDYGTHSSSFGGYWTGYNGETGLLIDEFYGWIRFNELLNLLDKHLAMPLNRKFGHVVNNAQKIVFTSNQPWTDWYKWDLHPDMHKEALERRIDHVISFRGRYPHSVRHEDYSSRGLVSSTPIPVTQQEQRTEQTSDQ